MRRSIITKTVMALSLLGLLLVAAANETGLWAYTINSSSWGASTVGYRVNPNFLDPAAGASAAQIGAVQAAADEWEDSGGANFSFNYQGTTSTTSAAADGVNAVFYSDTDGGGALAVCYWWSMGGVTTNFDIEFYDRDGTTDFVWSPSPNGSQFDIQGVATHELGHALGLGHSTVSAATMYPSVMQGSTAIRSLDADDIAGIQAIYGLAAPEVTAVSPVRGWIDGGYSATLSGSGFAQGMTVSIGGVAATNVTVVNPTTLLCMVPAGPGQGAVDVQVSTTSGNHTLASGFTYDTCRSVSGATLQQGWNAFECKVPADQGKSYIAGISTVADSVPMSTIDPLDQRMFPLGWSDVFYLSINAHIYPIPYWAGTFGNLSPSGTATFYIWGLQDPLVSGLQLHACFVTLDAAAPSGMSTISNRVTVAYP